MAERESGKRARCHYTEPAASDPKNVRLKVAMEVAKEACHKLGALGQERGKKAKEEETKTDLETGEYGKDGGSTNGNDLTSMHMQNGSEEAGGGSINGDGLTFARMQKGSNEPPSVDGDPINGDNLTSTHIKIETCEEAPSVDGGLKNGDDATFAHMGKVSNGDGPTSAHMEKAFNGHNPTSAHMGKTSMTSGYMERASNGHNSTPAHMGKAKEARIGPRRFTSSKDMLNFFSQLLYGWPLNCDINKYEHMMLEDLLKKGHPDFREKIGTGIQVFQVRIKKEFDSRCFYVVRKDGSMTDFSYRKCVDKILSLPKNLKPKFTRDQSQKGMETRQNSNAQVGNSKSPHNTYGREGNLTGSGSNGYKMQGRGSSCGQERGNSSGHNSRRKR